MPRTTRGKLKNGNRQPTLVDIAESVKVSPATVSLALNGSPLVAEETARRVKQAAADLNYRPHVIARRLSIGRSEVITLLILSDSEESSGWVLPSSWMFYNPILKGVSLTLSRSNYHLQFEIINADEAAKKNSVLKPILERATDGVLILVHYEGDYSFLRELENMNVPVVIINRKLSPNLSSVQIDNQAGARAVIEHLLRLGHHRIAHIAGPEKSFNAQDRRAGYLEALTAARIELSPDYLLEGDWRIESGRHLMQRLLALPLPPTAVFCSNDHMAVGAMEAIREAGLSVPDDISLVGFDDSEISRVALPRLTTVQQPLEELGCRAAEEVLRWPGKIQHVTLAPRLIERESCSFRR